MLYYKEITDEKEIKKIPEAIIYNGIMPKKVFKDTYTGTKFSTQNGVLIFLAKNKNGLNELNDLFKLSEPSDVLPFLSDDAMSLCKTDNLFVLTSGYDGELSSILLKNDRLEKMIKKNKNIVDDADESAGRYRELQKKEKEIKKALSENKKMISEYKATIKSSVSKNEQQINALNKLIGSREKDIKKLESELNKIKKDIESAKKHYEQNKAINKEIKKAKEERYDRDDLYAIAKNRLSLLGNFFKNLYVEIRFSSSEEKKIIPELIKLAEDTGTKLIFSSSIDLNDPVKILSDNIDIDKFEDLINNKINDVLVSNGTDGLSKYKKYIDTIKKYSGDFDEDSFNKEQDKTGWIMKRYPAEYACTEFNSSADKEEIFYFCKKTGIKILYPNINISVSEFTLEPAFGEINADSNIFYSVRIGFSGINGLRQKKTTEKIIDERKANGEYSSLKDFMLRTSYEEGGEWKTIKPTVLRALTESGCLDLFGYARKEILKTFDRQIVAKSFDGLRFQLNHIRMLTFKRDVSAENKMSVKRLGVLPETVAEKDSMASGGDIEIIGILTECNETKTKFGNDMLALKVWGDNGPVNVFAFGNICKKYAQSVNHLLFDKIKITGKINQNSITLKTITPLSAEIKNFAIPHATEKEMDMIKRLADQDKNGIIRLSVLSYDDNGKTIKNKIRFFNVSIDTIHRLKDKGIVFSEENKTGTA